MTVSVETFWSRVRKTDACWIWVGLIGDRGYGRYGKGGSRAHRVAYELSNGPIPKGLSVLHRCDNPSCVRPSHLFLGTQADNMRDMADKKRARGGAEAGIEPAAAERARRLHATGMSFSQIAKIIGSTHTTVARAVRRQGRHYADT